MKNCWTDIFFELDFKTPCSAKFRETISIKLAEAILEYSGINILSDSHIYLSSSAFDFKFEIRGQTAYFEHCNIGIEHESCPRLDWSYTSKSGNLITPESEAIDENDLEVKVDFIKMETFLESFNAKPMALPFSIKKYSFSLEIKLFCNDPLKLKVQVSDPQYIDHLINLVDTYILTRNDKIEAGKIDDRPIHNIRDATVMGNQIIFEFDFGMASPKTLKEIFDVFEKSGHVESVVLFSYG